MRKAIQVILTIAAVVAGLYVGLYVMFYGGIVQIVDAIQEEPIPAGDVALGVIRIVFAGFTGVITFLIVGALGVLVGESKSKYRPSGLTYAQRQARNRRGVI